MEHDSRSLDKGRVQRLRRRYGLTQAQYDWMLKRQGGVCAICKAPPGEKGFHIDHDHSCCNFKASDSNKVCGRCVRGLLCQLCNLGLGAFKDDPVALKNAIDYLEDH